MKSRFKVGDIVICLKSCSNSYTEGKRYKVKAVRSDEARISTELDDKGSTTNGWCMEFFELYRERKSHYPDWW